MNEQDSFTPEQRKYIATQMNLVSRSFALVVPTVEAPLNNYLAVAYLICRVVDNIEDCGESFDWKAARFDELGQLLDEPRRAPDVLDAWASQPWPGLTEDERALMAPGGGAMLWEIYGAIPERSRVPIRARAREMAEGMQEIEDPSRNDVMVQRDGVRLPRTVQGYNLYCYFVAGTVGHMATELVLLHHDVSDGVAEKLDHLSEACGRGLQKTNIVKDFARDITRGVCYLPDEWMLRVDRAPLSLRGAPADWTRDVLGDVMAELHEAADYVMALPRSAPGYRQASLLSLFPAYQTVLLAARRHDQLFTAEHEVKISRLTMAKCITDARGMALDDVRIAAYRDRSEETFAEILGASGAPRGL